MAADVDNPLVGSRGAAAVFGPQKGATAGDVAVAFLGARLTSGITLVLDTIGFTDALAGADLVVTGEGALDEQSLAGKAPVGVARAPRSVAEHNEA